MPTRVQSRASTEEPMSSSRVGVDKFPSPGHQDPMHHPSCDPRTKFNLQHREALRLALGSILAPKRPSMSSSHSSSGTASPAYSFSGSSGTYTPATPPAMPYTPSLESNSSQEHAYSRLHMSHPHYHPAHHPSKLGRVESHPDAPDADAPTSVSLSSTPPQHFSHPIGSPHPLFRSRSQNPSNPPSSRASPRIQPTTPPIPYTPPTITVTDAADLGPPSIPSTPPEVTTSNGDGGDKIGAVEMAPTNDVPAPPVPATQETTSTTGEMASSGQCSTDGNGQGSGGPGTPKAKFIKTLQGKSPWDALIHGSFS